MPVSMSSQSVLATLPSFMSVFRDGSNRAQPHQYITEATNASDKAPSSDKKSYTTSNFFSTLHRRDSTSTFSESVDSSPTTTISTLESSITEPSPSSPPESPESLLPRLTFKNPTTNGVAEKGVMEDRDRKDQFSNSFPTLPGMDRMDSPNKKMRNTKNLSVNTAASNRSGPQLSKVGLSNQSGGSHAFSAPPTPAFIVPPKAPRKNPSQLGLTITTPEAATSGHFIQERPATMASTSSDYQISTLRQLQTSSMAPLFSPTVAPEGGMRLPPIGAISQGSRFGKAGPPLTVTPRGSMDSSMASPITRQTLDHVKEEADYDLPMSQEAQSPAYPQGPVCIYDPYVHLYLEPSDVEARQFDVVLNVAREVKNPFASETVKTSQSQIQEHEGETVSEHLGGDLAGRDSTSELQTGSSYNTFSSALEAQQGDFTAPAAPSTPKALRLEPEYIHVPWDHNTNVVNDLLRLCELIDNRVRERKRVLVHCQCGVSRSASLVVAYGIFKNPQLSVQEAYDAVKNRSRWIGPNMNLIYQLSEFKTKLAKSQVSGTAAWHSWRSLGSGRSSPDVAVSLGLESGIPSASLKAPSQKAMSDPPHSGGREAGIGRSNSFSPQGSAPLGGTSAAGEITPGPSSAPPDVQWSPSELPGENIPKQAEEAGQAIGSESDGAKANSFSFLRAQTYEIAIEEKKAAPSGAVAQDLLEVAKDLSSNEHSLKPSPTSKSYKVNLEGHTSVPLSPLKVQESRSPEDVVENSMNVDPSKLSMPGAFPISPATDPENNKSQTFFPPHTELSIANSTSLSQTSSEELPAGLSRLPQRRPAPLSLRQLPFRQKNHQINPILPPQRGFDRDVPQTPSLLSPRAAEFTASPFHRTVAGDLAGSSVFEQRLQGQEEDPRSPHQRGDAPIVRSIFDMI